MSKREYMYIGYIRSNCLSKVASCIDDDSLPKTHFSISRSKQEKSKIESKYKWMHLTLRGIGDFYINWDIWKHKTPFQTVLNELTKIKNKYHYEDFVVNCIEFGIDDKKLIDLINKHLTEINNPLQYPDGTRFYVTFKNNPIAYDIVDGWDAQVVRDINLNAILKLNFKRGVLDLINIESDIKKNKGISEDITFLINEKEIIAQILKQLKTERWFQFPEVKKHFSNGHHPFPGAIRTYERKHGFSKWAFIIDEEVK